MTRFKTTAEELYGKQGLPDPVLAHSREILGDLSPRSSHFSSLDIHIPPIFQQNPLLEENVKITHVSTCWRCREAFASVQNAALTIFQQMLGVS